MGARILIVDDDTSVRTLMRRQLEGGGFEVSEAEDGAAALAAAAAKVYDAVLADVHMPRMDGIEFLTRLRAQGSRTPVIMVSGAGEIELAVRAVRLGAFDFLEKPAHRERLIVSLTNALRVGKLEAANSALKEEYGLHHRIIGSSDQMSNLGRLVDKAARSEARILITGENGSGKELVAAAIHRGSARADGPFVKLNCAAVPAELIESELFGHEKGSFTGAMAQRKGKFETAHGGTLFLDEVGDMPLAMQAKLLRVLQEGELERVGGDRTISVDTRVVAATNRDLAEMVAQGTFREDLYYRLHVIHIRVPSLRERREDIPALVESFLADAARLNRVAPPMIGAEAMAVVQAHDFPGNVRELRNLIEQLVVLADGPEITADAVRFALAGRHSRPTTTTTTTTTFYAPGLTLRDMLAVAERELLCQALAAHGGNMTQTARALGLERSHLYKKLKLAGIEH